MNKLFVAVVAISAVSGLVALLYFNVNLYAILQDAIAHPETIVSSIWNFVKDKVYYIIGIAGTAVTTILAIAKRVSDIKAKGEETTQALQSALGEQKATYETQLETLQATLTQKETEFADKFNTQADLITSTQQQANQAFQYRQERDDAIRELDGLRKEIQELREKYIVA